MPPPAETPRSPQVFISYRHVDPDAQFAAMLNRALLANGCEVFLDTDIEAGEQWSAEIEAHLRAAEILVVLLSKDSVRSAMVKEEVRRFVGDATRGPRTILPVRLDLAEVLPYDLAAYLNEIQYVEWLRGNPFEPVIDRLVGIVTGRPLPPPLPWVPVITRSLKQIERLILDLAGTDKRRGVFRPDQYVHRDEAEGHLGQFLLQEAPGLLLLGESGIGKTNLLCHWVPAVRAEGHAVFMYSCGALADGDVLKEISRVVSGGEMEGLEALRWLDQLASAEGRRCIFVFDALNDFRHGSDASPRDLLAAIDRLIRELPDKTSIRLVIGSSSAAWSLLERRKPGLALSWSRYYSPAGEERALRLTRFTPEELQAAYARYEAPFRLPPFLTVDESLREQFRTPLLLRMFAEYIAGGGTLTDGVALDNELVGAYLTQCVPRREDQAYLQELVALMDERRELLLPAAVVAAHPRLGAQFHEDDPESSWSTLLDAGVVSLRKSELEEDLVAVTFPMVTSQVLARQYGRHSAAAELCGAIKKLVDEAAEFPVAWDAARILLARAVSGPRADQAGVDRKQQQDERARRLRIESETAAALAQLAGSRDAEQRELVVATLAERHRINPVRVKALIRKAIESKSPEAQRTALKAAYCIGTDAREIFVQAVQKGGAGLRQAVKDTLYLIWRAETPASRRNTADALYLIWRRNPGFTREFMRDLLNLIDPVNLLLQARVLKLVMELSITIYVNHCEKPEVIEQTTELYHVLATQCLHLDRANRFLLRHPGLDRVLRHVLVGAFSGPILRALFPAGMMSSDDFFRLPLEARAPLARVAQLFDPATDLRQARDDLLALLRSGNQLFAIAAAQAIATHACASPAHTEPLLRDLFAQLDAEGQLWLLFSFCVLLPETPPEWLPLTTELTRQFIKLHPGQLWSDESRLLKALDFVFLPAGLACGKRDEPLTVVRELLEEASNRQDATAIARCLEGLAPVGFYFPRTALAEVRLAAESFDLTSSEVRPAMVRLLAAMRTLHLDEVDDFMREQGFDEGFGAQVAAHADVDAVHRYIIWLGYFNNAVHFCLHYPWMRRELGIGFFTRVAQAPSAKSFLVDYAGVANRMFHDADYQLTRWTGADPGEAGAAPPAPAG